VSTPISGKIQVQVYTTLERIGAGTIKEIAEASGLSDSQVSNAIDKFLELDRVYICDWRQAAGTSLSRVLKAGRGVNAPRHKDRKTPVKLPKTDLHLLDYRQQHREHQEFMRNFKPRPDVAAAWLLNPVQGDAA